MPISVKENPANKHHEYMSNALYYGDNLTVLRNELPDGSVDLIYLDPPFNSNANYNILFRDKAGTGSQAQLEAFEDTWRWGEQSEDAFDAVMRSGHTQLADLLRAFIGSVGRNDMMAYISMMSVRLVELYRILKPSGSLYLHCDPTASHYLKLVLDNLFGLQRFRNEIIWKRTTTHNDSKTWSRVSDIILFYTKAEKFTWNVPREPHSEKYLNAKYQNDDGDGRKYMLDNMTSPNPRPNMMYNWMGFPPPVKGWRYSLDTMQNLHDKGLIWYPKNADGDFDVSRRPRLKRYVKEQQGGVIGSVWTDIPPVNSQAQERLGYPTQKPLALLERIIAASSNPGDVVLDPFCGCGTAVHAAQKLDRRWIGIDVTHLAISLIERRLKDAFPGIQFEVHGTPKDLAGAIDLAERNKHQFQWWAVSLVNAFPFGGKKKGPDGGIDGIIYFRVDAKTTERAIVSVKGGQNINVGMVRDLKGTLDRERAPIGIMITLAEPTKSMLTEAAAAGFHETMWGKHPRVQILTIAQLLAGARPNMPLVDVRAAFKNAAVEKKEAQQGAFAL